MFAGAHSAVPTRREIDKARDLAVRLVKVCLSLSSVLFSAIACTSPVVTEPPSETRVRVTFELTDSALVADAELEWVKIEAQDGTGKDVGSAVLQKGASVWQGSMDPGTGGSLTFRVTGGKSDTGGEVVLYDTSATFTVSGSVTLDIPMDPKKAVYTGTFGTLTVSSMVNKNMTIAFKPATGVDAANLYVSVGDGAGLMLANFGMTKDGTGTYVHTVNHDTFTSTAKVFFQVLVVAGGKETSVPQGGLASVGSWSSVRYAYEPPVFHTVTFDSQGADVAAVPSLLKVTEPATTLSSLPTAPQRSGHVFSGWFTQAEGAGNRFDGSSTVTADVTVYAKWIQGEPRTVTFDSQGATVPASVSSIIVANGHAPEALPQPPSKQGWIFRGWFSQTGGAGTKLDLATVITGDLTVYAFWEVDETAQLFGDKVIIFDPSMADSAIQQKLDALFAVQQTAEFGTDRYAILFKPGTYHSLVNIGFYTQVVGLGRNVDDVHLAGGFQADGSHHPSHHVTQNFWRSVENLRASPPGWNRLMWAVSQAAPARRLHITDGELWLFDINPANGASGWASGGFLADSVVDGKIVSGGQQQWITRNSSMAAWDGGVWNMVYVGTNNAPGTSFGAPPNYTTVPQTPVIREKPYLYVNGSGDFQILVPELRTNASGITWASGATPGVSLPITDFLVAKPGIDTAQTINAALAAGKHLLFTPGVYNLDDTIHVTKAGTVVLGLGLATLTNTVGKTTMDVANVDGVTIAGLLFDAGAQESPYQLVVGSGTAGPSHAANPILLADVFFRVGGHDLGRTKTSLKIDANHVLGDNLWIWRADHGNAGTWGWELNTADTGLEVNGDHVTIYGLFVEHYQKYQTLWNGEGGRVYFYQSEIPYDVPNQAAFMNGAAKGYASFKINDAVSDFQATGLGIYCFFNVDPTAQLESAIEVPAGFDTGGAMFTNMVTVALGTDDDVGAINHVINQRGDQTVDARWPTYLTE